MLVKTKLKEFYKNNHLNSDGGVYKNWNKFNIGKITITLPNLNKKGYLLHDVNHILSQYNIDWFGEFETAAWELGSGGRKGFGLSWLYPITGTFLGLLIMRKRTITAYKKGLQRKNAHILSEEFDIINMDIELLYKLSNKEPIKYSL